METKTLTFEQLKGERHGSVFQVANGQSPSVRIGVFFSTLLYLSRISPERDKANLVEIANPDSWSDKRFEPSDMRLEMTATLIPTPMRVRLNAEHTAEVTNTDVKVGCQTFSFDAVRALAAAVEKKVGKAIVPA